MLNLVGNTPIIKFKIDEVTILGKAEFLNPSGSVKDRLVARVIQDAEENNIIFPGDTLIEATSGNTGISLAMFAALRGYNMKIVMPCNMSDERKQILKYYGAELIEVEAGDFEGAIALRDKLAEENGWFNCNQFHTQRNIEAHYDTTGPEIKKDVDSQDWIPQAFVAGTGTGGTIMGTARYLREWYHGIKIVAVEPAESPVMSGGKPGIHGIQGIGDGSKYLVNLNEVDDIEVVSTEDAKEMAKRLASMGYFVGISAGANVLASVRYAKKNDIDFIVTILCDRGERYLSCL
jgi:cysteine synthase A